MDSSMDIILYFPSYFHESTSLLKIQKTKVLMSCVHKPIRPTHCLAFILSKLYIHIVLTALFSDGEDNLLRVADPSFDDNCQPHTITRYYNCDIDVANDTEIVNNRTWMTCPTFLGRIIVLVNSSRPSSSIHFRRQQQQQQQQPFIKK